MEYLTKLPKAIPADRYLVHNRVYPVARRAGTRGSRYWLQTDLMTCEFCPCGWAPELGSHYRLSPQQAKAVVVPSSPRSESCRT
jgi:hypothetical protein